MRPPASEEARHAPPLPQEQREDMLTRVPQLQAAARKNGDAAWESTACAPELWQRFVPR